METNRISSPDVSKEDRESKIDVPDVDSCEEETAVNPWVVQHNLPLWWKLLVILTGPILLPVRLVLIVLLILFSYICAKIGLIGSDSSLEAKPLRSWRKFLQSLVFLSMRGVSLAMGVIIRRRGRQARPEEAPLLVAAPHSTLIDWLLFPVTRSSVVAKQEISRWPLVGVLGRLLQTVWVDRDSRQAKTVTLEEIKRRCLEPGWPQLLVFPEGTNTNGQALVLFRSGAFSPSKPVQPVSIKTPNMVDTVTWTWVQRHTLSSLIFFTLISPFTIMDVEFLPVIQPTEDEIEDARVYAKKVRKVLGEHLNLPCSEMSYRDAKLYQQEVRDKADESEKSDEKVVSKYASNTSIDFVGNLTFGI